MIGGIIHMADHLKFKHPFTAIVGCPTSSGKTSFTLRFLQNLATLCTELNFAGGILWSRNRPSLRESWPH
jgi:hypothetical protein